MVLCPVHIRGFDTSTIAKFYYSMPGLWWVSIQIKGTKALVRVTNYQSATYADEAPAIIAAKDGIIANGGFRRNRLSKVKRLKRTAFSKRSY